MIQPLLSAPRLRLSADGMTAKAIVDAIAGLIGHQDGTDPLTGRLEVAVDVTNAWSIPWTAQPLTVRLPGDRRVEAYLRHKGFHRLGDRTEAVYEVAA